MLGIDEVMFVHIPNLSNGPVTVPHTSDAAYEASLRRDLNLSRREKGPAHEDTLAHLSALAVHLQRMGKCDEARSLMEESAAQAVQPDAVAVLRPHPGAQSPQESTNWLVRNARPFVFHLLLAALTAGVVIVSLRWPWAWLIGVPVALVWLVGIVFIALGLAGVSPVLIALCPKCSGKTVWWRQREIMCQKCGILDWPET
jgi:hypothetical protein